MLSADYIKGTVVLPPSIGSGTHHVELPEERELLHVHRRLAVCRRGLAEVLDRPDDREEDRAAACVRAVPQRGLGRIVALCYRSSTSYQIH